MANQTDLLNVSMMNDGKNLEEELCSFSVDECEELYSSSTSDTCRNGRLDVKSEHTLCSLFNDLKKAYFKGLCV